MQLTDGGTFHERSQFFMKGWICGSIENSDQQPIIKYSDKGRAWNRNSGELGVTMNAAMLATIYGTYIAPSEKAKSERYLCWARSQVGQLSDLLSVALMGLSALCRISCMPWSIEMQDWCWRSQYHANSSQPALLDCCHEPCRGCFAV